MRKRPAIPRPCLACLALSFVPPAVADTTVVFYHTDHIGSTNLTTDQTGAPITETLYYPFGAARHVETHADPVDEYYRYGGKERDPESGLNYFEARYLAEAAGRFISADALHAEDPTRALSDPQRSHPYAYVHNNPLAFADPSGLQDAPVYSPGYDTPGYSQGASDTVKLVFAGLAHTVVEALGGANTANAPESASAPRRESQTTGEVVFRTAVNAGFGTFLKRVVQGIVAIEAYQAAAPAVPAPAATPPAKSEWVSVEVGKPIPGVKAPPITNPRLAAALNKYTPSTPAQQLANKGQRLLAEHIVFGARRPGTTLLNMAQAGQRAEVGQLHQFFVGQHQHVVNAAAQQGASKQMLDSLKNLADMTVPLSGK